MLLSREKKISCPRPEVGIFNVLGERDNGYTIRELQQGAGSLIRPQQFSPFAASHYRSSAPVGQPRYTFSPAHLHVF